MMKIGKIKYIALIITILFVNLGGVWGQTWIGGGANDWNNPACWSPFGVPLTTDTVLFTGIATVNVTANTDIASINVQLGATVNLSITAGNTLTITANLSNAGILILNDDGTLRFLGDASFGSFTHTSGEVLFSGGNPQSVTLLAATSFNTLTIDKTGSTWSTTTPDPATAVNLTLQGAGTITFTGEFNVTGTLNNPASSLSVEFNGDGSTISTDTTFQTTGTVSVGNEDTDTITFTGDITHQTGPTAIAGHLVTSNTLVQVQSLQLGSDSSISTGGGNIEITGNVTNGTARDLILTAGGGNIIAPGTFGTNPNPLGILQIVSATNLAGNLAGANPTGAIYAARFEQNAGTGITRLGSITINDTAANTERVIIAVSTADVYITGTVSAPDGFSSTGTGAASVFNNTGGSITTTNSDIIINHTDAITIADALSSGTGDIDIDSTGSTVEISNTVTSSTGDITVDADGLTTVTALVSATGNGSVAFAGTLNGDLSLGVGPTTVGGATGGNISFGQPVTLTAPITISTGAAVGDISFGAASSITGAQTLQLTAGTGNIAFGTADTECPIGATALTSLTINSANNVTFNSTVDAGFVLQSAGGAAGTTIFRGDVTTSLANGINVTNAAITLDELTLTAGTAATASINLHGAVALETGAVSLYAGDDIHFYNTVSGGQNLTIETSTAATSRILFDGIVGTAPLTPLGDITITDAYDLTFSGTVDATRLRQVAGSGTTLIQGLATITGANGVSLTGTTITIGVLNTSGGIQATNGLVEISNSGTLTIHDRDGDTDTGTADIDAVVGFTLSGVGAVHISGDITTTAITFAVAPELFGDVALSTGGGNIAFNHAGTAVTHDGTARDLVLTAGGGNIIAPGTFGTNPNPLGILQIVSATNLAGNLAGANPTGAIYAARFEQNAGTGITRLGSITINDTAANTERVIIAVSTADVYITGTVSAPDGFSSTGTGAASVFNNTGGSITTTNSDIIINHTDAITIADALSSGTGDIDIDSTGSTVEISNTVTSSTGDITVDADGLTTVTALVSATGNGSVAFAGTLNGDLSLGVGPTTVGGATGGNISFGQPVTLTAPITISTGAAVGDISFGAASSITGAQTLQLTAGTGNIAFGTADTECPIGATALTSLTINSANNVTFNSTVDAGFVLQSAGGAAGTTIFRGDVTTSLANGINVTNAAITLDELTLTAGTAATASINLHGAVALETGAVSLYAGDDIHFYNTVSGGQNLTIETSTAATSRILFDGIVGTAPLTPLGDITITDAYDVTFSGTIDATRLRQGAGTGTTLIQDSATITGANGVSLTGANITIDIATADGSIQTTTGPVEIINSGTLIINDSSAAGDTANYDIVAGTGFSQTGTGPVSLYGDIRATTAAAGISFARAITLYDHVRLNTNVNGAVTFADASTVNADVAVTRDLIIEAGSGGLSFGTLPAVGNAQIGDTIAPRSLSATATGGNVVFYGGIALEYTPANMAFSVTANQVLFHHPINVASGNVSIDNAGLLRTEEDADFTLSGATSTFTKTGAGACLLAGGVTTAGGAIAFGGTGDVYLFGTAGNMEFSRNASWTDSISFDRDLHIACAGKTVYFRSPISVRNLVLYAGIIDFGSNATRTGITASQDIVLLRGNPASMYDDSDAGQSGVTGLFAYENAAVRGPGLYTAATHVPLGTAYPGGVPGFPGTYSGAINAANLAGKTLTVGGNFYANGVDLNPGAGWTLSIPDNESAFSSFAEAYNLSLANCAIAINGAGTFASLSAAEATDGLGNDAHCVFNRPRLLADSGALDTGAALSGTYTMYDDVIRVEFVDNGGTSARIENTNDEISAAVANIQFGAAGGPAAFTGSFADAECTISTNDVDDVSVFYLRTDPANATQRWNTDATGSSAGHANSVDRGRSGVAPAHRTSVPSVDIPKALAGVYQTLRDEHKNRILNTSIRTPTVGTIFAATADRCRPVLVGTRTGQELHTVNQANQRPYDAHNFIEFTWSEPVDIGGFDALAAGAAWPIPYAKGQAAFAAATDWGGAVSGAGPLTVEGYASIQAGSVSTGSRGTYAALTPNVSDPTVSGLYRDYSPDGAAAPALQTHSMRVAIAGWCEESMVAHGTTYKWFWQGYIDSAVPPSGTVSTPSNPYIRDRAPSANVLEPTAYNATTETATGTASYGNFTNAGAGRQKATITVTDNATPSGLYSLWDTTPPFFSGLKSATDSWVGDPTAIESIPVSSTSGLVSRLEMHFFDNEVAYSATDPWKWLSRTGWYVTDPATIVHAAPETFGGIRPNDGAMALPTHGGVRDGSFRNAESAFSIRNDEEIATGAVLTEFVTTVNSVFYNLTATLNVVDDPYATIRIDELARSWPIASAQLELSYEPYSIAMASGGFVTDLAGNRLGSTEGYLRCLDRTPPKVTLTLSGVNRNELYMLFSKNLATGRDAQDGIRVELTDAAGGVTVVTPTTVATTPASEQVLVFTLPQSVTAGQLINPLSIVRFADYGTAPNQETGVPEAVSAYSDILGNYVSLTETHRLTDLGIGLVEVLYASDGVNTDGVFSENEGALRVFDGTGRLLDRNVTVGTRLVSGEASPLPLTLFFDVNPPNTVMPDFFNNATGATSELWLPSVLPSFNKIGNTAARSLGAERILDNLRTLRNFVIPEADDEMVPGSSVEMLFRYGDLYCPRLEDESDITSVAPWGFRVAETKKQRGGVTILNNVIDSNKRERAILNVEVPSAGNIVIQVFTLDGNLVRVLDRGRKGAGNYTYYWDGSNVGGRAVARGMYFIRVVGPDIDEIRKVMVIKE